MAQNSNSNFKFSPWMSIGLVIVIFLTINLFTTGFDLSNPAPTTLSKFYDYLEKNQVDRVLFNNTKATATLNFKGEIIELAQERAASGIWYKNDNYELRGKGNDIELKKDGKVVFKHEDDIVSTVLQDKEGNTLNMTFNNTDATVKVYLNGGQQIDLVAEKAASGIWYKNDLYELRGKGEHLELTKEGKTIFKN